MEIIVKKNLLDELQAKGICNKEESEKFLNSLISEIAQGIRVQRIKLDGLGTFFSTKCDNKAVLESGLFLDQITKTSGVDRSKIRDAFALLIHFIKNMLIKGYEVQIIDFASLRIEEKKAQVIKSAKNGQNTMIPAKKLLIFEADKSFLDLCEQAVRFEVEEEFRKQIEHIRAAIVLLVVPKRDFAIKTVEYHFEKSGWKINTCHSIEDAQRFLQLAKPHLVILDSQVEKHQELCEILKCNARTSFVPLIMLYPKTVELAKTDDFRICGNDHIIQPFEIKQLINLAESVVWRTSEEETILRQEVIFQFPTIDKHIDHLHELCSKLFAVSGLEEEGQITFTAAFREAVANAAQHGNKHRRDRMLEVLYLADQEKIVTAITDSGNGFDWQNYVQVNQASDAVGRARQSQKEGKMGGLGIMLMSRCVDKIEYNDIGNMITLIKYLQPAASATANV